MQDPDQLLESPALHLLAPGEAIHAWVRTSRGRLDVTDRRLLVTEEEGRVALNLPIEQLRRIQFDIERSTVASLVIVPADTMYEVQVLAVATEHVSQVGPILALVAERLAQLAG